MKYLSIVVLICLISWSTQAQQYEVQTSKTTTFLSIRVELDSLKDIGMLAKQHVPALYKEAKDKKFEGIGKIHHFYYGEKDKFYLAIALPVEAKEGYKSEKFQLITQQPYQYIAYQHKGPVSGIGESWEKLHAITIEKGELRNESIEIYLTDLSKLSDEETVIQLRDVLVDKSTLKGECIVTAVMKQSNAKKAGIKKGDQIISYGESKVLYTVDVIKAINKHKDQKKSIAIKLLRGEKEIEVKVKPGALGVMMKNQ